MEKWPFAEKIAISSINWPNLTKKLIRSDKCWWKLPIRSSQICLYWLISRWYKNDMQEFLKLSFFHIMAVRKLKFYPKKRKTQKFWRIRPCNICLVIQKSLSILLYHLEIYLHEKIWLNPTCKFSKFRKFTWKFYIFSTQWDFP